MKVETKSEEEDPFNIPSASTETGSTSTYATHYMTEPIPKFSLPQKGIPAPVVYQLIRDMRTLDARPNLNLASFVTTWMEPEARELMQESLDINFVNVDEYPSCTTISKRCLAMLGKLYHVPGAEKTATDVVGAACVGSSEAILLSGLALKKRWVTRRQEAGKSTATPNLVMGSETHVCWEKFCRYFDVEPRYVTSEEGRYIATPSLLEKQCDENTIGVVAVFGSTYTGEFEDVKGIDAMVSKLNKKHGWGLSVHVDGASGAFIAPFLYPTLPFDFRLPNVASINVSGHKYGLVYPGIGWVIWRSSDYLPESMVFYAEYLGTVERTVTLNFSRGASQIVGQYYQFLRLGVDGYTAIMTNLRQVAAYLTKRLKAMKHFTVVSKDVGVPLVAFRLDPAMKRPYTEYQIAERVRLDGWVIPAYPMPKGAEEIKMLRIVVREDFSLAMADHVLDSLQRAIQWLDAHVTVSLGNEEAAFFS